VILITFIINRSCQVLRIFAAVNRRSCGVVSLLGVELIGCGRRPKI